MITVDLDKARKELESGGIIALPTETVYGLAGNALDEDAVGKIFSTKKRPHYNPLIVHIKSADYLPQVARDIPDVAYHLARSFWPGPLTLVLKKQPNIPDAVTSGKDTVAVRVPDHPLTLELLEQLDFPLAAPSANPFGSISPTSAAHVEKYFGDTLPVILDGGECRKGIESTIIGFEGERPVVFRMGSLSLEEIMEKVGEISFNTKSVDQQPSAPGMLLRHYAPVTDTYLTEDVRGLVTLHPDKKIGLLLFQEKIKGIKAANQEVLSPTGDLEEAAHNLYAAMHRLDSLDLDMIIAERFPDHGLGKTINDKLERATHRDEAN
ncbi:translation factor SUA5 [Muriicola jejuensis]|uniref:Threonylcarbamoyl-AMP synthase n=1 Tax=Muriicola jejuensis TaxID=504488 RepID=A0A6P0UEM2_9FLAO|nr:L-threonylcarbamoyladenylate synthase [Muriicola jejuensis]NER11447.1 threonylcarbamoyl-AMP synthase [Muriicola jejuensis]SMP20727.1 translation factor SUA5 [Muriicola jejuensis]